jgi:hypothetical protein
MYFLSRTKKRLLSIDLSSKEPMGILSKFLRRIAILIFLNKSPYFSFTNIAAAGYNPVCCRTVLRGHAS